MHANFVQNTVLCTRTLYSSVLLFRYYDQDLALARDLEDRMSMGRAYCNLGLAHLAIGNMENALECQKYFLGQHLPPDYLLRAVDPDPHGSAFIFRTGSGSRREKLKNNNRKIQENL